MGTGPETAKAREAVGRERTSHRKARPLAPSPGKTPNGSVCRFRAPPSDTAGICRWMGDWRRRPPCHDAPVDWNTRMNDLDKGVGPATDNDGRWLNWLLAAIAFGGAAAFFLMASPARPPVPAPPTVVTPPAEKPKPADIKPAPRPER